MEDFSNTMKVSLISGLPSPILTPSFSAVTNRQVPCSLSLSSFIGSAGLIRGFAFPSPGSPSCCPANTPQARAAVLASSKTPVAVPRLAIRTAFTTPSFRGGAFAGDRPVTRRSPRRKRPEALIVEDTTEVGTPVDATFRESIVANAPPDATPAPDSYAHSQDTTMPRWMHARAGGHQP